MEPTECKWYDVGCGLNWIGDELQAWALWFYDSILSGVAIMFEAIPVPDFLIGVGVHTMPPGVAWAASAFELPAGMGIVVSAYIARFILRRLPVIG